MSDSLSSSSWQWNYSSGSIVYSLNRQSVVQTIDLSSGVALEPTPSEPTNAPVSSSSSTNSNVALPFLCVDFQLLLDTDLNAKHLSWSVQNQSSAFISKEAGSCSTLKTYNETYCLDPRDCPFFECNDYWKMIDWRKLLLKNQQPIAAADFIRDSFTNLLNY
jgi:hypothetical protein